MAALLFERLEVETDPDVRRALVLHKGYQVVDGVLERLVDLMRHDPDPWLRSQAAFRLEWFDARAVPPLIEALRDPPVARAAAMSFGRMGDVRALPGLVDAWSDPRHHSGSHAMARAAAEVADDSVPRAESDPLVRFAVMVDGARRHPALRDAIPGRRPMCVRAVDAGRPERSRAQGPPRRRPAPPVAASA